MAFVSISSLTGFMVKQCSSVSFTSLGPERLHLLSAPHVLTFAKALMNPFSLTCMFPVITCCVLSTKAETDTNEPLKMTVCPFSYLNNCQTDSHNIHCGYSYSTDLGEALNFPFVPLSGIISTLQAGTVKPSFI